MRELQDQVEAKKKRDLEQKRKRENDEMREQETYERQVRLEKDQEQKDKDSSKQKNKILLSKVKEEPKSKIPEPDIIIKDANIKILEEPTRVYVNNNPNQTNSFNQHEMHMPHIQNGDSKV